jgi:hypothetical protein
LQRRERLGQVIVRPGGPAELLVYDPDAPLRERPVPQTDPLRSGADLDRGHLGLDDD